MPARELLVPKTEMLDEEGSKFIREGRGEPSYSCTE